MEGVEQAGANVFAHLVLRRHAGEHHGLHHQLAREPAHDVGWDAVDVKEERDGAGGDDLVVPQAVPAALEHRDREQRLRVCGVVGLLRLENVGAGHAGDERGEGLELLLVLAPCMRPQQRRSEGILALSDPKPHSPRHHLTRRA
eukprot:2014261-Rhodomonas_salina.1